MDNLVNFGYGIVATAPSPATSGTSLILQTGQGAAFPVGSFDVTLWPSGTQPIGLTAGSLTANAEIARATVSGDTLTLTRAQYGTTAMPVAIGYQVSNAPTAALLNQLVPKWTWSFPAK